MRRFCAIGSLYGKENPAYLSKCLVSLRAQTASVPIYLALDGPLTDDLERVLLQFDDLCINFVRLEVNSGLAIALQAVLEEVRGSFDFAIRFDTDDINEPFRFERTIEFINRNKVALASSHMHEINESSEIFSKRRVPVARSKISSMVNYRNPFNHPATVFQIEAVMSVGGYLEMPFFEDWYLWSRLLKNGYAAKNIDDFLVKFRATDQAIRRRYGLTYMKHESIFFWRRWREGLVPFWPSFIGWCVRTAIKLFGFSIFKRFFLMVRK